ncbi:MAG: efflux RND transporter permease subunit [Alphaproteobacteria bacterium]
MSIVKLAIGRTRVFLFSLFLCTIAGVMTYQGLPKESYPDINIPRIVTRVTYTGISPEDGERLIAKPLEKEFKTISGLKEMTSRCYENYCMVIVEFDVGHDAEVGLREVKDAVDTAKQTMPADIDEPVVKEINTSEFPIAIVNIYGTAPEKTLMNIAKRLQDTIEALPGVLEAELGGDRDEQIEILIDPAKLDSYKLSIASIGSFLGSSNILIPAGNIETEKGSFPIKVPGLIENVDDVLNLPIKTEGDAVITLKDIAEVRRNFANATEYVRMNGQPSLSLEVKKKTGGNTINVITLVKKVLEEAKDVVPNNVVIKLTNDSSENITENLIDLQNNVISSMILVIVCVVLMLGTRTGLLVGLSIPISFLMGLLFLGALGIGINMVVLFGLILAVGMLVDGAIVITEYADKKMTEGANKVDAYAEASDRMAMPVIASTLTTLVAFGPLMFWPGIIGEFMKYLPISVICVLSASLIVALIFIPIFGAIFGKAGATKDNDKEQILASENGEYDKLTGYMKVYYNALYFALSRPWKILGLVIIVLFLSFFTYAKFGVGVEFFPESEPDFVNINVHARGNFSIEEKSEFIKQVENLIEEMPYFVNIYSRAGAKPYNASEDTIGYIQVELKDWQERPRSTKIIKELEDKLAQMSGVIIEIVEEAKGPVSGKPIELQISANEDNQEIIDAGYKYIEEAMNKIGGFVNVENTLPLPGIQWEMNINKAQAAKFGVTISSIGSITQMITRGAKVSSYMPADSDEELDIVVRFPKAFRALNMIDNLYVVANTTSSVPLSTFVDIIPTPKVNMIQRIDGKRIIKVAADVEEGTYAAAKVAALKAYQKQNPLPKDVQIKFAGQDEDSKESMGFVIKAFIAAVFLMGFILLAQFNSFYDTFMILFSILLSTIGVVLGLVIMRDPFSIVMTGLAIVSLAGIVVNNNIVLIDAYNEIRAKVSDPFDALIRTGLQRIRPVYLTTVTTILGLVPMALKLNIDFINANITIGSPSMDMWSAFSKSVIFGLSFATILTLIVTPCMILIGVNVRSKFHHWWTTKVRKNKEI